MMAARNEIFVGLTGVLFGLLVLNGLVIRGDEDTFDWQAFDECLDDADAVPSNDAAGQVRAYGRCCEMDTSNVLLDCSVPLGRALEATGDSDGAIELLAEVADMAFHSTANDFEEELFAEGIEQLILLLIDHKGAKGAEAAQQVFESSLELPYITWKFIEQVGVIDPIDGGVLGDPRTPSSASPGTNANTNPDADDPDSAGAKYEPLPGDATEEEEEEEEDDDDPFHDCWEGAELVEKYQPANLTLHVEKFGQCCPPRVAATRVAHAVQCHTTLSALLSDLDRFEEADSHFQALNTEMFKRGDDPGDETDSFLNALGNQLIMYRNWEAKGPQLAADLFFRAKTELPYVEWKYSEQPVSEYYRDLRAFPWWDPYANDWLPSKDIEAAYPQIRAEFDKFLAEKASFNLESDHSLISGGSWKEFLLWEDGLMNETSCEWMPTACTVFGKIRQITGYSKEGKPLEGQVTIFQLAPGTHLRPHTGTANDRLTAHLGLIIPEGVSIRVANDTGSWGEGKMILFDDSFEHEVWHRGTEARYVIYATVHHPDRPIYDPANLVEGPYDGWHNLPEARNIHDDDDDESVTGRASGASSEELSLDERMDECMDDADDVERLHPMDREAQLAAFHKCLEIDPEDLDATLASGKTLIDMERFEEADEDLTFVINSAFDGNTREGDEEIVLDALAAALIMYRNWEAKGPAAASALFWRAKAGLPYVEWQYSEQPIAEYYPDLRAFPWWDPYANDWLPSKDIEAAYPQIRAEFDKFLAEKASFNLESDHSLISGGSWKEFLLWEDGLMNETSCEWMPTACTVFGKIRQITGYSKEGKPLEGQVTIFQLAPGTHLRPHTGTANDRLTAHLGLIIPEGVSIRVANDTGSWGEGKMILFDDSFEHEVWHRGTEARYVIYATVHHPDRPIYDPANLVEGPYDGWHNLPEARRVDNAKERRSSDDSADDGERNPEGYNECLDDFDDAEELHPMDREGQLEIITECCAIFPTNLDCRNKRAGVLIDMGRLQEADGELTYILDVVFAAEKHPLGMQSEALFALGNAFIMYRNWEAKGPAAASALFWRAKAELPFVEWQYAEQPVVEYYPDLRAFPWWDPYANDWLPSKDIEAAYPQIRAEFDKFLAEKASFNLESDHSLISGGSWKEFLLWEDGLMNETSCEWMPTACTVFGKIRQITGYSKEGKPLEGQVTIFQLAPGTHLRPHTGTANDRLTAHLGLIIPEGVSIRVANDTGSWGEGKMILFDDSFEHEVWHRGTEARYVIYATVHHPDRPIYDPANLVEGPYDGWHNLPEARSLHDDDDDDGEEGEPEEMGDPSRTPTDNAYDDCLDDADDVMSQYPADRERQYAAWKKCCVEFEDVHDGGFGCESGMAHALYDMDRFAEAEVLYRRLVAEIIAQAEERGAQGFTADEVEDNLSTFGDFIIMLREWKERGREAAAAVYWECKRALPYCTWTDTMQPIPVHNASLRAMPFWDPYAQDWLPTAVIEDAFPQIRAELDAYVAGLGGFHLESDHSLVQSGSWSEFLLYDRGIWNATSCAILPSACAAYAHVPQITGEAEGATGGQITVFRLTPGTTLRPHTGTANDRLTLHLGLVIPDNVFLTVGNETRTWTEGKLTLFDDSFEHSVAHKGDSDRYVLYATVFHPDRYDPATSIAPVDYADEPFLRTGAGAGGGAGGDSHDEL